MKFKNTVRLNVQMNINRFSPKQFKKMVKNKKDLLSPYRIRKTITHKNVSIKSNANVQVHVRVRPPNEKELKNCQRYFYFMSNYYC